MQKETDESKNRPSRLTAEQVTWINSLLFALLATRLGLGGYFFVNKDIERFADTLGSLLLVCIAFVVCMGPNSKVKTLCAPVAITFAILGAIGGCAIATDFDEYPDRYSLVGKTGDVSFNIVSSYDVTYYDISRTFTELQMERTVLNGILKQHKTLISVQPTESAEAEMIDGGKNIRFTSPALLGRKAIVRTYSTDWDKASRLQEEIIELTKAEQEQ